MKEILSLASAIVAIIGLMWYNKAIKSKRTKPNMTVIILWNATAIINTVTYIILVQDFFKSLLLITGAIVNIVVSVNAFRSKNYLFLKRDVWIIAIGSLIITGVILLLNVKDIYLMMQILTTVPYIPLIIGIIEGKGKEPINAWFLIFVSTVLGLGAVMVEYTNIWSIIHPLRSIILQVITMICIQKFKGDTGNSAPFFYRKNFYSAKFSKSSSIVFAVTTIGLSTQTQEIFFSDDPFPNNQFISCVPSGILGVFVNFTLEYRYFFNTCKLSTFKGFKDCSKTGLSRIFIYCSPSSLFANTKKSSSIPCSKLGHNLAGKTNLFFSSNVAVNAHKKGFFIGERK